MRHTRRQKADTRQAFRSHQLTAFFDHLLFKAPIQSGKLPRKSIEIVGDILEFAVAAQSHLCLVFTRRAAPHVLLQPEQRSNQCPELPHMNRGGYEQHHQ